MANKKDVITPAGTRQPVSPDAGPRPSTEPRREDQIDTMAESLHTTLPEVSPVGVPTPQTEDQRRDQTLAYPGSSSASAADPAPGKTGRRVPGGSSQAKFAGMLGRFHYVRMLGEGAFGSVQLVWDPELQTHRAVKVPHRHLIDSKRVDPESYVREARKIAQLGKHPGIVGVLDVQRMDDGTPYVVSEYVPGGSLADRVKAKTMNWQEAVAFVAQVAEAIGHAHSKGVVHRDLKPSNILITEKGDPVVADFGLALGDDEFSYQSSVCGTYQYMSPQQVRGEADRVDGRADVFSLGVILYQLLAGRLPYKSREVASLKREILEDEPTPVRQYNQEVPAELEEICRRALAKDLSERYSTAGDFAAALRGVLSRAGCVPAAAPVGAGSGSKTTWLTFLLGAAALGALGLFIVLRPPSQSDNAPTPVASVPPQIAEADPDLTIHVQKANVEGRYEDTLTPGDLPLQVGDRVQFHIELPKPQYVYVYLIDFRGEISRLWPEEGADLAKQERIKALVRPARADKGTDAQWYELTEAGGPEVVLVGVSDRMLSQDELAEVESHEEFLRGLLDDNELLVEFEHPRREDKYVEMDGVARIDRGFSMNPVVSPKTNPIGYRQLTRIFTACHAWIFQTE